MPKLVQQKAMITGFPPIAAPNAKILILGSIPGTVSLEKQEYYAHPRNSFWDIIVQLTHSPPLLRSYQEKKAVLMENHIALWDVLKNCQREGSLDSSIQSRSIITNDFESFYSIHRFIKFVIFNGAKAEKEYNKRVLPRCHQFGYLTYYRLPSTSPAMAQLSKAEKSQKWLTVMNKINQVVNEH